MDIVRSYRFDPSSLAGDRRKSGISAFMRIRNGDAFLEPTIRSHIDHVDEIVAVDNNSTDSTAAILRDLQASFGPDKLRIFDYRPHVFPPGSAGHAATPADSAHSFVAMSNFVLGQTRYCVAMKLDDDHIAMEDRLSAVVTGIRNADCRLDCSLCFSGVNLARDKADRLGVLAAEPLVGAGDHFFFEVGPDTHFTHDPRFEDFNHGGKARAFSDITYWHMKHLKPDFGFGNRDIDRGDNPRFSRKRRRFLANRRVISLDALSASAPALAPWQAALPLPEKLRLKAQRWTSLRRHPPDPRDLERWGFRLAAGTSPAPPTARHQAKSTSSNKISAP